jgi:hypothetical protein
MKKLFIGVISVLALAVMAVMFVNAAEVNKDNKKSKAAVQKEVVAGPCAAKCDPASCHMTVPCDPEKCKEMGCIHKNGKCDPTTCAAHKEGVPCTKGTPCPVNCCKKK